MIKTIPLLIILLFACQCGQIPTPEPTVVPTSTATSQPTATPTRQISPTASVTAVPTQTATPLPTVTVTAAPATPTPLPTLAPSPVATVAPDSYTIQKDDWLVKIAQFLYGSRRGSEWRCLYEANRAVIGENPHLIYRGQKLVGIRECGE